MKRKKEQETRFYEMLEEECSAKEDWHSLEFLALAAIAEELSILNTNLYAMLAGDENLSIYVLKDD